MRNRSARKAVRLVCTSYSSPKEGRFAAHPLPRIDENFQNLQGASYFTLLDLKSGYWQVRLSDDAKLKAAFTNAPATFQMMMNDILRDVGW